MIDRDTIIKLAREADVWVAGQEPYQSQLERFANLVAAHEREACAKEGWLAASSDCEDRVASAIRSRK